MPSGSSALSASSSQAKKSALTSKLVLEWGWVWPVATTETILSPFTTTGFNPQNPERFFYPSSFHPTLLMQPGTPMADLFPPGHAALRNPRRPNPPPGFGPRHNQLGICLCLPSFVLLLPLIAVVQDHYCMRPFWIPTPSVAMVNSTPRKEAVTPWGKRYWQQSLSRLAN